MTPDHLIPIEPASAVEALCERRRAEQDEALPVRRIKERLFTPRGLSRAAEQARRERERSVDD